MSAIVDVIGRRVWDSRGRPTVEAELRLVGGYDVRRAAAHVNGPIRTAVTGMDAADQAALDRRLIALDGTPDKLHLGGNALLAVSLAAAHATAAARGLPLWRSLQDSAPLIPLPQIQIFGGGAHAGRRIDIQDLMVMCPGAASFAEALDWTAEIYRAGGGLMAEGGRSAGVADEGGWWPDFASNEAALEMLVRAIERAGFAPDKDVGIALDIAASEFGRNGTYRLALENRSLDSDGMILLLGTWLDRYPILSIEDPLAEDDLAGFARFTQAFGHRVQIVGDDLLVTDAARLRAAVEAGAANTVLLKPNQRGTLTEMRAAWEAAKAAGFAGIVSARSGETMTSPSSTSPLAGAWASSRSAPSPVASECEVERSPARGGGARRHGAVRGRRRARPVAGLRARA